MTPAGERDDAASHEADEDRARAVLGAEEALLGEVEAALRRLADGTFGRCEACAKPIPSRRLEALPYARYCVVCAKGREPAQEA